MVILLGIVVAMFYLILGVFVPTNIIFDTTIGFGMRDFTFIDFLHLIIFLPFTLFVLLMLLMVFTINRIF